MNQNNRDNEKDLKAREYTDKQGNVHHHTKEYMERQGNDQNRRNDEEK